MKLFEQYCCHCYSTPLGYGKLYAILLVKSKKDLVSMIITLLNEAYKKDREVIRLNFIIDKLEEELELNLPFRVVGVRQLKNKLKELKELNRI